MTSDRGDVTLAALLAASPLVLYPLGLLPWAILAWALWLAWTCRRRYLRHRAARRLALELRHPPVQGRGQQGALSR